MPVSLVASAMGYTLAYATPPADNTITVGPIDCTGANCLVAVVGYYAAGPTHGMVTDTALNRWMWAAEEAHSNGVLVFLASPPLTDANVAVQSAQYFTYGPNPAELSSPNPPVWAVVLAFSGMPSGAQVVASAGAFADPAIATVQPGPITGPTLAVTGISLETNSTTAPTIDSGFSVVGTVRNTDDTPFGNHLLSTVAWRVIESGTVNPTWSQAGATYPLMDSLIVGIGPLLRPVIMWVST